MSDVYAPKGRPSLLTEGRAEKILAMVKQGHFLRVAATANGISQRTIQRWLARGEEADDRLNSGQPITPDDERYWHFWQDIRTAEADAEIEALDNIRAAWATQPQWAAWFLERKRPAEWGRRTEVAVGPNDRMLEVLAHAITVDQEEDTDTTVTPLGPDQLQPPPH